MSDKEMAKAEQKYVIDGEALNHLLAMIRDGASDSEISEQTFEILDSDYRAGVDRSLKEAKEG
ncbi:MAG: hypothetical protein ABSA72_10575 [Nitrososphaerales archaeon]